MSETLYERVQEATGFIRSRLAGREVRAALVLGSGLGPYADGLSDPVIIDYHDIPFFPTSTVDGHAGRLVVGEKHGMICAAMQGRVHYYEGHPAAEIAFPARVLVALGARVLLVTNAAGGLRHPPGTLMLIRDHLNLLPDHPLRGPNDDRLGPRFPDMTATYTPELRDLAKEAAAEVGVKLAEGVYACLSGPTYETPAEVSMLAALGADATGMSTVPEVIAARHMGADILGISCITNYAAGLGDQPLSHDEVKETADRVRDSFESLLDAILTRLAARS